ncbi:alpha/beta hydrolase [Jannaschia sp. R86511]|uniref:alpha/beta hydrolase n=1 Tax=Jannaschia sp. R86511 TaxID=3093853 RepID=UPI0036D25529
MVIDINHRVRQMIGAGAGPTGSALYRELRAGDPLALRALLDEGLSQMSGLPAQPEVRSTDVRVTAADGGDILLRWSEPEQQGPGSAVVYLHGGAMLAGSVDLYDPLVRTLVAWSGVPFLSVDYRLAPEAPAGTAAEDGFLALRWLLGRSGELGVDPARIAVMGDSAGGGIAAAVAVLARDRGLDLARQILVYPMLDDRTDAPDPHLEAASSMFSYDFNRTAWTAVLGPDRGSDDVPQSAAPARTADLSGLAPAYIEVGEVDIFRDEDVAYAQRLWRAGVSTALHVHAGMPHAFDVLLTGDEIGARHREEKVRVLQSL